MSIPTNIILLIIIILLVPPISYLIIIIKRTIYLTTRNNIIPIKISSIKVLYRYSYSQLNLINISIGYKSLRILIIMIRLS